MRHPAVPSILEHQRGLRSNLLRKLPRLWHEVPRVSEIDIPPLKSPAVAVVDLALSAGEISAPAISFDIEVQGKVLTGFDVRVFGIRYRSHKKPEAEVTKPLPPLGLPTERNSEHARQVHPYAHLYDLLYPPPADVAADQIPAYAILHAYQKVGVEFLVRREHALLADDMGLGKTAMCSVAMAILRRSERIGRTLIICPRALVRQWEQEAKHWAGLHLTPIDGTPLHRKRYWESFPGVLITTPNIVLNDAEILSKCHFDLVVCDDVSMLKNPGKITNAIRRIPRIRSWCLSGTPLENKPEDFINVMEFVYPGLFSVSDRMNAPSAAKLQQKVKPYFLRRRKADCLKELPPKQSFEPIPLELTGPQWEAYRMVEFQRWRDLKDLQASGVKIQKVHVFSLINALLQICNVHLSSKRSAKAEAVKEQLEIILDTDRDDVKAVVFSRWVETLRFLEQEFRQFKPQLYHGGLSDNERTAVLNGFRKEGRLLLMSTKAGSRGLNLQEASYVFHFDRGWNPVEEMQAEDRCWRLGQKQRVSVYRYIQIGTIEERIHQVLMRKRGLFDQYVNSLAEDTDPLAETQWSLDELIDLLRPTSK